MASKFRFITNTFGSTIQKIYPGLSCRTSNKRDQVFLWPARFTVCVYCKIRDNFYLLIFLSFSTQETRVMFEISEPTEYLCVSQIFLSYCYDVGCKIYAATGASVLLIVRPVFSSNMADVFVEGSSSNDKRQGCD